MSVRNLRDRWEKAEGWMRDETGGRERGGGVDIRLGNSKATLTLSHCGKEEGGACNLKSSLRSRDDLFPRSFASSPKSVLKKTSTVGSLVHKKRQSSSGCKHHNASGRSVHFEDEGSVKGGDLFPYDDDNEMDRRLLAETIPRVLDMYTSDDEEDETTSLAATTRAIYIGGLGEERNRKKKSDESDVCKYFSNDNAVRRHDREEKNSVARCSTFSPSSTSKLRKKQSRHKNSMSVMDRVKVFSAKSENEVADLDGCSDDEKSEKAANRRRSFKRLEKGAVGNLREQLAGAGFDPSLTPGHIEDMINRGEKGDIKCNISDASDIVTPTYACRGNNKGREDVEVWGQGREDEDSGGSDGDDESQGLLTLSRPSQNGNENHSRTSSQFVVAQQEILSLRVHQWEGTAEHHRAAVRLQTLAGVLIARAAIRRKLVSEVTAFSIIAERGISMMKHPFHGRHRPKPVTVCISKRNEEVSVALLRCLRTSKTLHPCS